MRKSFLAQKEHFLSPFYPFLALLGPILPLKVQKTAQTRKTAKKSRKQPKTGHYIDKLRKPEKMT